MDWTEENLRHSEREGDHEVEMYHVVSRTMVFSKLHVKVDYLNRLHSRLACGLHISFVLLALHG